MRKKFSSQIVERQIKKPGYNERNFFQSVNDVDANLPVAKVF